MAILFLLGFSFSMWLRCKTLLQKSSGPLCFIPLYCILWFLRQQQRQAIVRLYLLLVLQQAVNIKTLFLFNTLHMLTDCPQYLVLTHSCPTPIGVLPVNTGTVSNT